MVQEMRKADVERSDAPMSSALIDDHAGTEEIADLAAINGMTRSQFTHRGWIVLIAMLFAGIVAVMNQFQVPLFMNSLIGEFFPDSPGNAGWLMSVIAIAAVVIAYPSAFLLNRFSPKGIGAVGLAVMVVGATIGAASSSAAMMIFGRILQGAGVAVMGIVATTIIAMYFPRERAGVPMGIWNLWYTGGATLAYNIGVPIAIAFTGNPQAWHPWFWFCDIAALLAFIVFCLVVRVPLSKRSASPAQPSEGIERNADGVSEASERASSHRTHRPGGHSFKTSWQIMVDAFKVPRMWLLGVCFGCLMFTSLAVLSWVPTYVQDVETGRLIAAGMSHQAAAIQADTASGTMASIGFASSIPMSFVTAWLLGRFTTIRARNNMLLISAGLGFLYCFAFIIPYEWLPWWLVLLGLESGWTSGVVWSLMPLTMPKPITISFGMATVIFFQGVANLLATPVVGYVIGSSSVWAHVAPLCACTACVGVILCLVYHRTKPPVFEERVTSVSAEGAAPIK